MDNFSIIYEDQDILVIHKPAGIAVQTKRLGQQDLESQLKNYRMRKKETPYIGIVHRLDQPVEGIMVFAKNPKAASSLSAQVQKRQIGKYYLAKSIGTKPNQMSGTLTDYLDFDPRKNLGTISDMTNPRAKKAVLDYKVIGCEKIDRESGMPSEQKAQGDLYQITFRITLHTGRHHQIRLQFAHMGYPLIGDTKYGGIAARKLELCSVCLEFRHPVTGKEMKFSLEE